ncbi:MAG: hypothetical protein V7K42_15010 [Nostoc sp.]
MRFLLVDIVARLISSQLSLKCRVWNSKRQGRSHHVFFLRTYAKYLSNSYILRVLCGSLRQATLRLFYSLTRA